MGMIQLFYNSVEDNVCIVSLLMNLLKIIKVDCTIPLPTTFVRKSMNNFFPNKNFNWLGYRRMDGNHTRSVCKKPNFRDAGLRIYIGNSINIV